MTKIYRAILTTLGLLRKQGIYCTKSAEYQEIPKNEQIVKLTNKKNNNLWRLTSLKVAYL